MGPPLPPRLKSAAVHAGMVATSGVAWVILWMFNKHLTSAVQVTSGISLVYLPAGFRLLIILVFGGWGALGIFLFEPLLFFNEFEAGSAAEVFATSAISGFSPWLVTVLFCRAAGISPSLSGLRPAHLPTLALALSLVTPLIFNVFFVAVGRHPAADFMRDFAAMATGDFLGCVIVIGAIKLAAAAFRKKGG